MPDPLADPERFAALAAAVADPVPRYLWRRTNESQTDDVLAATLDVLHRRADDLPDVDPVAWRLASPDCNSSPHACSQPTATRSSPAA